MKVYKECCNQCLLSPNKIVSGKRAKEIIQGCVKDQTHFICYKATIDGKDIACKTFYDQFGYRIQLVRIAQRLGAVQFINQPKPPNL